MSIICKMMRAETEGKDERRIDHAIEKERGEYTKNFPLRPQLKRKKQNKNFQIKLKKEACENQNEKPKSFTAKNI